MSVDRSLKVSNALNRHRNVLSRAERVERLIDEGRLEKGDFVTGLPKVSNRKVVAGKKKG
ncbi:MULTISPECIES: small basic protein [Sedimentisphaera]|uniref:PVC superphylum signature protein n=2 Tax=Sedimentisphaera TaxID=2483368 RepID=A0A1W6LQ28_9BACT|nr:MULTISPECIES: small basic protein [Sedimentisphaera]AQQ08478.1 PVC superphylum signature protein [Sedimentisphaera cyanobacteriorum]ARN57905.1 PVC superphylum signature protein [Sedimentisphaera salicampi]OXU14073.1 PVC superphylum signature protein [Sedimentisphaera salicampi]